MGKVIKKLTVTFFAFLIASSLSHVVYSSTLRISVATNKPTYNLGENILISGNLTLDETPVPDGLVIVEVDDPRNDAIVIRTRPTGPSVTGPWLINIVEIDVEPDIVRRGDTATFEITLTVVGLSAQDVTVALYIQYSNNVSFTLILPAWEGTLYPGLPWTTTISRQIDEYAPLGTATVYASAFTYQKLPKNGAFAYCPEYVTTFTITGSTAGSSSQTGNPTSENGTFGFTIATLGMGGMLGDYAVHACSYYSHILILNHTSFKVELKGDITGLGGVPDGKVDMKDIAVVAKAFGSEPGEPGWNPIADLYPDGKIDMKDVAIPARNFGKWGTLP